MIDIYQKFLAEKIEDEMFDHLNDSDLIRLGVETIGDRLRLRHCMRTADTPDYASPSSSASSSSTKGGRRGGIKLFY